MRLSGIITALVLLAGCSNSGTDRLTVIVGATVLTDTAQIPDSVVVIDGKRIRAVGPRPMTPIPQDSERIDGAGRYVKAEPPVTEIAAGQPADLVMLDKDRRVERRMVEGKWTR
jgi:N-acetylglucosamine-6-phosphate deacetylase